MSKEIHLTKGCVSIVDDEDYEYLNQWKWCCSSGGYALRTENKKQILMHRRITKADKNKVVDHINKNTLDNRKENLRICTKDENNSYRKMQVNNTSGYRGVRLYKPTGKGHARIGNTTKKGSSLGYFVYKEDAALAYDNEAIKRYGKFAVLNFPKESDK